MCAQARHGCAPCLDAAAIVADGPSLTGRRFPRITHRGAVASRAGTRPRRHGRPVVVGPGDVLKNTIQDRRFRQGRYLRARDGPLHRWSLSHAPKDQLFDFSYCLLTVDSS